MILNLHALACLTSDNSLVLIRQYVGRLKENFRGVLVEAFEQRGVILSQAKDL